MSLHVVYVCVFIVVYCIRVAKKGEGEKQHLFSTKVTQKSHLKFKELQGFYSVNLHQKTEVSKNHQKHK